MCTARSTGLVMRRISGALRTGRALHLVVPLILACGGCRDGVSAEGREYVWRAPNTSGFGFGGQPSLDDSRLFVGQGLSVVSLGLASGETLWSLPLEDGPVPGVTNLPSRAGRVFV